MSYSEDFEFQKYFTDPEKWQKKIVIPAQTSRFKIKKKIENSQKPNLDHNALIFIFSLKNSLLKLFSRPRVQRPLPFIAW